MCLCLEEEMEYSPSEPDSGDSRHGLMVPKSFTDRLRELDPTVWLEDVELDSMFTRMLAPTRRELPVDNGASPDFRHVASNIPETQEDEDDDDDGHFTNMLPPIDGGITLPLDLLHVPSNLLLETILQDESSRPHDVPLRDLQEITDNFSDERILGRGGFGVVYKGVLPNGKMIAVKKIASSLMSGLQKQFESEVRHLMMLTHKNIVRCVGYCCEIKNACLEYNGKHIFAETAERLLCLEYMPK